MRLADAEIVAASSYQKDGRPAPARLIAVANKKVAAGSHVDGRLAIRRITWVPREKRSAAWRTSMVPIQTEAAASHRAGRLPIHSEDAGRDRELRINLAIAR